MKSYPILFSTAMVRAILDGKKTQTRRIVKGRALEWLDAGFVPDYVKDPSNGLFPFGIVGDVLWVRETWARVFKSVKGDPDIVYRADFGLPNVTPTGEGWKPSIFMPKNACRIMLEITSIGLERLNQISESDAIAEGIEESGELLGKKYYGNYGKEDIGDKLNPVESYRTLWESINGVGSWTDNPWVWVIEFKVIIPKQ